MLTLHFSSMFKKKKKKKSLILVLTHKQVHRHAHKQKGQLKRAASCLNMYVLVYWLWFVQSGFLWA